MKLIEASSRSVTLKFSRTEFESLSLAFCMLLYILVNSRHGVVKLTAAEQKIGEAFLPKIRALLQRWTLISIENGWDEDDDYE